MSAFFGINAKTNAVFEFKKNNSERNSEIRYG